MGSMRLTQSFQVKPVPGMTTPEQVVRVWVIEAQLPCSSITERCVVNPGMLSCRRSGSSWRRILAAIRTACSSDISSSTGTGLNAGSVRWLPRVTPTQDNAAPTTYACSGLPWSMAARSNCWRTFSTWSVSSPPPGTADEAISRPR
jgi:hypothetical protein